MTTPDQKDTQQMALELGKQIQESLDSPLPQTKNASLHACLSLLNPQTVTDEEVGTVQIFFTDGTEKSFDFTHADHNDLKFCFYNRKSSRELCVTRHSVQSFEVFYKVEF